MDFHFTLSVGLYHGLKVDAALKLYRQPVPQTANMIPGDHICCLEIRQPAAIVTSSR